MIYHPDLIPASVTTAILATPAEAGKRFVAPSWPWPPRLGADRELRICMLEPGNVQGMIPILKVNE